MRAVSTSTQLQYSNWPISLSVIYANGYVAFDYLNIAPECVESMKEKKKTNCIQLFVGRISRARVPFSLCAMGLPRINVNLFLELNNLVKTRPAK